MIGLYRLLARTGLGIDQLVVTVFVSSFPTESGIMRHGLLLRQVTRCTGCRTCVMRKDCFRPRTDMAFRAGHRLRRRAPWQPDADGTFVTRSPTTSIPVQPSQCNPVKIWACSPPAAMHKDEFGYSPMPPGASAAYRTVCPYHALHYDARRLKRKATAASTACRRRAAWFAWKPASLRALEADARADRPPPLTR